MIRKRLRLVYFSGDKTTFLIKKQVPDKDLVDYSSGTSLCFCNLQNYSSGDYFLFNEPVHAEVSKIRYFKKLKHLP